MGVNTWGQKQLGVTSEAIIQYPLPPEKVLME